jgi:maltose alpha-D-glucosyltransferase/alpha-amylase
MFRIVKYWLDLGIDGFRADAVPYLFERDGTISENLRETHMFLKQLRSFMTAHYPESILLCEANQWPEDVRHYFGDGTDEVHMGFHFPLMPRLFMALGKGDVSPIVDILARTPPIPVENQWCVFLRNHDELTLEMVTQEEREWMWERYAPKPRMRLNLGIRRRLAPLLDNDRRRIELLNSLLFTLPGSPIIYYGDEIGMGDDIQLEDRNGVRTPMQWEASPSGGFSMSEPDSFYAPVVSAAPYDPAHINVADQLAGPGSLLKTMKHMLAVRRQHKAFGWGEFVWLEPNDNQAVAAYYREHEGECLLVINNLSGELQPFRFFPNEKPAAAPVDQLTGNVVLLNEDGRVHFDLRPYQYLWLKMA